MSEVIRKGDRVVVFDNPGKNKTVKEYLGLEGYVVSILKKNGPWPCRVQFEKNKQVLNFNPTELIKLKKPINTNRRERPRVRKVIKKVLQQNPRATLRQIANRFYISANGYRVWAAGTMSVQAGKMVAEKKGFSNE